MNPEKPIGLMAMLAAELAIALLFGAFSWSMTRSLAQGRTPLLMDTVMLAMPSVAVIACGFFAVRLWRRGKRKDAWGLALLPFPLALVLFMALGAV